jgi:F-type H+-transporting ATPase subunit gamma
MTRLAEVEMHIGSMSELLDIVGAMRSLAGMRMQEAQHALPGIRGYAAALAGAIGQALLLLPEMPAASSRGQGIGTRALILCAAEHGFVGGLDERLVAAAEARLRPDDLVFVLGSRGAAHALERGLRPVWSWPMAARCAGAADTAQALAAELFRRMARHEIGEVQILYAKSGAAGELAITCRKLLPADLGALKTSGSAQPPLHNLAPSVLVEKLVLEYFSGLLTEAVVEAVASENAARFAAMESAHGNVTKKLDELRRTAAQVRQEEITTELLDLVAGAEAQKG